MRRTATAPVGQIETLAARIGSAKPYWAEETATSGRRKPNALPTTAGVYLILRRVDVDEAGYRMKGVSVQSPLVLYVGRSGNIRERMRQHFGGSRPNYQGSQFAKFLFQVCQDDHAVRRILDSPSTLIAYVEIEEGEAVIDAVEKLAMQVFRPRFNIKDR